MPIAKEKKIPKWVMQNKALLEQLKAAKEEIDSYSKLDSYRQCKGTFNDTYNLKLKRANNIYAIIGGELHDALEDIYDNSWTDEENTERLQIGLNKALIQINEHNTKFHAAKNNLGIPAEGTYEIKFMNEAVEANFMKAIEHYIKYFKKENTHRLTEALVVTKLNGRWMQGFIDVIQEDENGPGQTLKIIDYKTSTMWIGKDSTKEHARQMILYAWMIQQQMNVKVTAVGWDMLKYINIKYKGKTRKKNTLIRRDQIFTEKYGVLKEIYSAFKEKGYDAVDTASLIAEGMQTGKIPDEVIDMFEVWPGYVDYPINDEIIQETVDYLTETMNEISTETEWERIEINKDTEMYCTWLCNNRLTCPVRKSYYSNKLEKKEEKLGESFDNVFG